jgi:FKBP-type peptidyl-prolyl cis-trans isomerase
MKALALTLLAAAALSTPALAAPAKAKPAAASATQTKLKITDPVAPTKAPEAAAADPAAAFLATNAKAPGVITLPSGLQYKVVTAGDPKGRSPKPGDIVKVNYEGKLVDGTVFDSSFQRGKPALMPLGNLIPAWIEALPKMHVGDEWVLYVPPALGYGPEGRGPIPPNSVMIFRLQFLDMLSAD